MKTNLKSILREISTIIIGILIALFINNWNEKEKEKKYFNEILLSIKNEIQETKNDIDAKLIIQKSMIDTLNFYTKADTLSLNRIMNKTNGVSIPNIRLYSWKSLSNSKIQLLDYKDLSTLATIEEGKELLREKSRYLMNFLYTNIAKKDEYQKMILKGLMMDIMSTEHDILSEINKLDEGLKTSD